MSQPDEFELSYPLSRALDQLQEINKELRWIELAHAADPQPSDLGDYAMLAGDLTATLQNLLNDINPPPQQPPDPLALAVTAFPRAIGASLTEAPPPPTTPEANVNSQAKHAGPTP